MLLGVVADLERQSRIPARDPPDMRGVTRAMRWQSGGKVNVAKILQSSCLLALAMYILINENLPKDIGMLAES